jgi:hypothetical protein
MNRKDYQKPTIKAVKLQFKCQMLTGTTTPPNTPPPAPGYDDWFG